MKKFINNVEDILTESLNGFALSHSDILRINLNPNFITRAEILILLQGLINRKKAKSP